jgi:hypothetical protein
MFRFPSCRKIIPLESSGHNGMRDNYLMLSENSGFAIYGISPQSR